MTADDQRPAPNPYRVWRLPKPLGAPVGSVSFGSTAAPLLAGFSLSAVVSLTGRTSAERGLRGDVAIAIFSLAASLLVFAIQSALTAATFQTSPTDRLALMPQARQRDEWMLYLREQQWKEAKLALAYRTRTRISYNVGIQAFLTGLMVVLVPGPGGWTPPRISAFAIACAAVAVELVLISRWPPGVANSLAPRLQDEDGGSTASSPQDPDSVMPSLTTSQLREFLYDDPLRSQGKDLASADLSRLTSEVARLKEEVGALRDVVAVVVKTSGLSRVRSDGAGHGQPDTTTT